MDDNCGGHISYRTSQFVDTAFGIDGKDPTFSTVTGDHGIFISIDVSNAMELDEELCTAMDSVSGGSYNSSSGKCKFYKSLDNPNAEFKEVQQLFLDEVLRCAGLGNSLHLHECGLCHANISLENLAPSTGADNDGGSDEDAAPCTLRCSDCGDVLQCLDCCLKCHKLVPLHFLEEWKGKFCQPRMLKTLRLVYQLGHEGLPCPNPEAVLRVMVVMDCNTVHCVKYQRCACDHSDMMNPVRQLLCNGWYPVSVTDLDTCATFNVLEQFQLQNVVGGMNAHDFVTALERRTSTKVPDRYKAFLQMPRQYVFLQRAKQVGCGHDLEGLVATKKGGCVVMHLHKCDDPLLRPGWGAFVEPSGYKEHLKGYIMENNVSTCIAFAALTQKETRNMSGLCMPGVGGCVCACHKVVRPNGLGDLQKGERYVNMDYILMVSLAGFDLMELTVSYDIACQWQKNLCEHVKKLPEEMRPDFEKFLFQCGLPIWHALSHEAECTNRFSLSFLPGIVKTDSEGIEQLWAELNAFVFHMKKMGLRHHVDSIEDKIDYHNHMKNLGQDCHLQGGEQEHIPGDPTQPNPYLINSKDGLTEAEIRVMLKSGEEEAVERGAAPLHGMSATAFLTAGLQLEDSQYMIFGQRIKAQISGLLLVTADCERKIQDQQMVLQAKLRPFCRLQQIYTPGAIRAVEREEAACNPEAPAVKPGNWQNGKRGVKRGWPRWRPNSVRLSAATGWC
ncbi:hypothetical protein C8R44DRAFT_732099 [Mycena epipterygia]|nr:hypothetical protein C8R44DRAFT_732099 [Mycena epipterygia]